MPEQRPRSGKALLARGAQMRKPPRPGRCGCGAGQLRVGAALARRRLLPLRRILRRLMAQPMFASGPRSDDAVCVHLRRACNVRPRDGGCGAGCGGDGSGSSGRYRNRRRNRPRIRRRWTAQGGNALSKGLAKSLEALQQGYFSQIVFDSPICWPHHRPVNRLVIKDGPPVLDGGGCASRLGRGRNWWECQPLHLHCRVSSPLVRGPPAGGEVFADRRTGASGAAALCALAKDTCKGRQK